MEWHYPNNPTPTNAMTITRTTIQPLFFFRAEALITGLLTETIRIILMRSIMSGLVAEYIQVARMIVGLIAVYMMHHFPRP